MSVGLSDRPPVHPPHFAFSAFVGFCISLPVLPECVINMTYYYRDLGVSGLVRRSVAVDSSWAVCMQLSSVHESGASVQAGILFKVSFLAYERSNNFFAIFFHILSINKRGNGINGDDERIAEKRKGGRR